MPVNWIDLLDPTEEERRQSTPGKLDATAVELLLAPPEHDDDPRPTLQGHGDYVFGIVLLPVAIPDENGLYYQEVDMVVTGSAILTVRKTPPGGREPYDPSEAKSACKEGDSPGMIAYRLV